MKENKPKCSDCRFQESRPEVGMSSGLLYCSKKRMVLAPKAECNLYRKSSVSPRALNRRSKRFHLEPHDFD